MQNFLWANRFDFLSGIGLNVVLKKSDLIKQVILFDLILKSVL